jgi:hypothetical protein
MGGILNIVADMDIHLVTFQYRRYMSRSECCVLLCTAMMVSMYHAHSEYGCNIHRKDSIITRLHTM